MNLSAQLIGPRDAARLEVAQAGGKGANLARLQADGFPVPAWFGLASGLLPWLLENDPAFAPSARVIATLVEAAPEDRLAAGRHVRDTLLALEPPAALVQALEEALTRHIPPGRPISVRSSAADEDGRRVSFAGLHDSFLFVHGAEEAARRVLQVWASAWNERALAYRQRQGLPVAEPRMAVVLQEMVDAAVSGIAFTANPNTGNVQEILISACYGAGEGIVSAGLDADLFVVAKQGGSWTSTLARKTEQLRHAGAGESGLRRIPVPAELQERPSLSDPQLRELAQLLLRLEARFREPQDVEFSLDEAGRLFLLQARPVTTVSSAGPAAGNPVVWDNSNIIESYSGPTSPMTFSFIRHAYTIVYHCFARVMGIPPAEVERNRHVFQNMLGLFHGRVYYNLHNWYRLVALFPGFRYNKAFMESMMGLKDKLPLEEENAPDQSRARRLFVELPRLLRLLWRSLGNFRRLDRLVATFQADFHAHYSRWRRLDLERMAPHELLALYREMESALLWKWDTPIINDFYVMIHYGLLKKLCADWCGDAGGALQNDLICGEGDIESTRPTKLLMEIARTIRARPDWRAAFEQATPDELAASVPTSPELAPVYERIAFYLDEYGFRCINELKLEEPSLKETPRFVYQVIQNYLRADEELIDPARLEEREQVIRREAEGRAHAALGGGPAAWLKRRIFQWILGGARRGVRNRENLRFARTRIYGLLRELLNSIGRTFEREGLLDSWRDIYLLTIDEVWDFILGTAVSTDLRGLAELRRRESDSWRAADAPVPDDHFTTWGMACHRNDGRDWRPAATDSPAGGLQGIGCCPGQVRGAVRVVASPLDDLALNGEILAAGRTDPGWVPLYPSISGLLIERGSILSHSAIVAREMGIPTIVGIAGLLAALKDGQVVVMDGSKGLLSIEADGDA
ncbi:MAG: PEP/pyruvate-binding domain-containing protein [Candidatus Delongbacteria bacterium]